MNLRGRIQMPNLSCPNFKCAAYGDTRQQHIKKNGKDRKGKQRYICKSCGHSFIPPNLSINVYQRYKKGVKSQRGIPQIHEEVKKKISVSVTPSAINGLDSLARQYQLSRSELIEQIGRGTIGLTLPDDSTKLIKNP